MANEARHTVGDWQARSMDEFGEALPNAEDNARLIIAASKMLKVLQAIKTFGELSCVSVDHGHIGSSGKKPATKDVWQFPRHMLVAIDEAIAKAEGAARPDPRDPDHSKTGIFVLHNCYRCKDGTLPCVQGSPNRCEFPHARDD